VCSSSHHGVPKPVTYSKYSVLLLDLGIPQMGDAWIGAQFNGFWANKEPGQDATDTNADVIEHVSSAPLFGSHR